MWNVDVEAFTLTNVGSVPFTFIVTISMSKSVSLNAPFLAWTDCGDYSLGVVHFSFTTIVITGQTYSLFHSADPKIRKGRWLREALKTVWIFWWNVVFVLRISHWKVTTFHEYFHAVTHCVRCASEIFWRENQGMLIFSNVQCARLNIQSSKELGHFHRINSFCPL